MRIWSIREAVSGVRPATSTPALPAFARYAVAGAQWLYAPAHQSQLLPADRWLLFVFPVCMLAGFAVCRL